MHESMVNYTHSTTGVTIRYNFRETNVTLRYETSGIYLSIIPIRYTTFSNVLRKIKTQKKNEAIRSVWYVFRWSRIISSFTFAEDLWTFSKRSFFCRE